MQGIHKGGEFWQLEIWTWKGYVKLPILHNSKWAETSRGIFMQYTKNTGANNHRRGAPGEHKMVGRAWPQARPSGLCSARPTSGAHLLVYRSFWPRKKYGEDFRDGAPLSRGGTSLPEGEIIVIIITNNSPILGRAISINIFNSAISSQTLVHLLCSIFVPEP